MDAITRTVCREETGMNIIFGICMGAVIFCLAEHKEFWYVALAIVAFVIYVTALFQ